MELDKPDSQFSRKSVFQHGITALYDNWGALRVVMEGDGGLISVLPQMMKISLKDDSNEKNQPRYFYSSSSSFKARNLVKSVVEYFEEYSGFGKLMNTDFPKKPLLEKYDAQLGVTSIDMEMFLMAFFEDVFDCEVDDGSLELFGRKTCQLFEKIVLEGHPLSDLGYLLTLPNTSGVNHQVHIQWDDSEVFQGNVIDINHPNTSSAGSFDQISKNTSSRRKKPVVDEDGWTHV